MDLNSTVTPPAGSQQTAASPPQIESDQRPVADAAKTKIDATPEIPLPIPSIPSQSGLISAASVKPTDAAPKLDTSGVSAAERTLKPYGVSMLPEKIDSSDQNK